MLCVSVHAGVCSCMPVFGLCACYVMLDESLKRAGALKSSVDCTQAHKDLVELVTSALNALIPPTYKIFTSKVYCDLEKWTFRVCYL